MPLILAAPQRAGMSSRGTPRLRGPQRPLHGAVRLASSSSRCGRSEEALPLFGVAATVTTAQQSTPSAASSCVWTGRLQAGPDQIPTFRGQRQSAARAGAAHHRACAALTNTMSSAVLRRGRCFRGLGGHGALCALTFELSGRRRRDARPGPAKMYRVPPDRAWWPAGGAPLE